MKDAHTAKQQANVGCSDSQHCLRIWRYVHHLGLSSCKLCRLLSTQNLCISEQINGTLRLVWVRSLFISTENPKSGQVASLQHLDPLKERLVMVVFQVDNASKPQRLQVRIWTTATTTTTTTTRKKETETQTKTVSELIRLEE